MKKALLICAERYPKVEFGTILKGLLDMTVLPSIPEEFDKHLLNTTKLILLCSQLPEMNNFDLVKKIKTLTYAKDIPIVVFGHTDQPSNMLIQAIENGCEDYLNLPMDRAAIASRISNCLIKKGTVKEDLELFRHLINESNDALYVIDPHTSKLLDINKKACEMLNYSREELLRLTVIDIDAIMLNKKTWDNHVSELKQQNSMFLIGKHIKKDKTIIPVEISVRYVSIADKDYMIATTRNINELTKREQLPKGV